MRLPGPVALLVTLATLAAADYMVVETYCDVFNCTSQNSVWYTAFGSYPINANEGCRDPSDVPGMNQLCMDWGRQRGHFFFDGQGRRCLRKTEDKENHCAGAVCHRSIWSEVACTW
ncbi:hypothetical protein C8A05DRAFT_18079 [Staphylotrichum tortipilum]|uniref:Secreted protein n=1 Tax=Staphylotrichum tortipilum TaxID=2831512 RepID=A0AAN6MEV1_9PEZI|nr:hypothetical protein C8A05DRAFT_18079 [Staphylotrichum longicolle]